jgi:PIN domain nuclease of toxin-antitoxin system
MNLLLDTHIWVWNHLEPWKISSEVNRMLAASENELWLSPVSVWELIVLLEKKRLELDRELHEWVERSKRELMLREAPLSWEVADELRFTILKQRDPADRFLVATAKVYDLTLVTADEHLVSVPGLRVLQNRC